MHSSQTRTARIRLVPNIAAIYGLEEDGGANAQVIRPVVQLGSKMSNSSHAAFLTAPQFQKCRTLTLSGLAIIRLMMIPFLASALALASGCGGSPSSPASTPPATRVISLNGSLDFGDVTGGANKDLTFSISNSGTEALNVSGITLPGGFTASWSSGTVPPGQPQNVTVRFTPTLDQNYSGTLTVVSSAATGSNTLNISARGIRTGRVSDPVGDTGSDARVAISPDLTEADVRATGGVLFITLTFAAGTVSPQSDIFSYVVLDTDENPATGFPGVDPLGIIPGRDAGVIGVDYMVEFVNPRGSTVAEIIQVGPTGVRRTVGTTGVEFQGTNQFLIGVPLALLGGEDGHLAFKVNAGKWATLDQQRIRSFDYVPNIGLPAGLTP